MSSPAKESRKRRRLSLRPLIIRECDDAIHPGPIFQSHLGSIIYPIEEGRKKRAEKIPRRMHSERFSPRGLSLNNTATERRPQNPCPNSGAGRQLSRDRSGGSRNLGPTFAVRPRLQGKMTAAAAERAATFRLYTTAAASTPGAVFSVRRCSGAASAASG